MKTGKHTLEPNQIRQICLGLASGKSYRALSRQIGLHVNRVNRTACRIQSVSGGRPEELVSLDDQMLLSKIYAPKSPSIESHSDSVKDNKYIPNFAFVTSSLIIEKRMSVIEAYRWYQEQCEQRNAQQLSQAYFYPEFDTKPSQTS